MSDESIKINMNPNIIVKASPSFQDIDEKATAGVELSTIIERNTIEEYVEDIEEDGCEAGE